MEIHIMEEETSIAIPLEKEPNRSVREYPSFVDRIVRRRIAISLTCFLSLIVLNLVIRRTLPFNPIDGTQLGSMLGMGSVLAGLSIRSWAAGTLHKSAEVTSIGPYALVRNPLYVGSFLMMFGFCILMKDWFALAFAAGPLTVLYWFQVRVEEHNLSNWFGPAWEQYAACTGRFFPRKLNWSLFSGWSAGQWLRNREYQAVFATSMGLTVLWLLVLGKS